MQGVNLKIETHELKKKEEEKKRIKNLKIETHELKKGEEKKEFV